MKNLFLMPLKYLFMMLIVLFLEAFNAPELQNNIALKGEKVLYDQSENFVEARNNATLFTRGYIINADELLYDNETKRIWVKSATIHDREGKKLNAKAAFYDSAHERMEMTHIAADLGDNNLLVAAYAASFNDKHLELQNVIFTPCSRCNFSRSIWSITARSATLDEEKQDIIYRGAKFRIYDLPIIYLPYLSHPAPHAKARSGLLTPNLHNGTFNIPYYWRIKPNMDAIIQPRFAKHTIVYQGQFRHLIESGTYTINASYAKMPMVKSSSISNTIIKDHRVSSFYIGSDAFFQTENGVDYGATIDFVSDKPFLKDLYHRYDSYLTSSLFATKLGDDEYVEVKALYFQNLFNETSFGKDAFALPEVKYKKFWEPFGDSDDKVVIQNEFMNYRAKEKVDLLKNSFTTSYTHRSMPDTGDLVNITAYHRGDIYLRHIEDIEGQNYNKVALSRSIPELQLDWRRPAFASSNILLEPRAVVIVGRNDYKANEKFRTIGMPYYEISPSNLYMNNRYGTTDFHEYGTRLNYGLNGNLVLDTANINGFIGEGYYFKVPSSAYKNQIVGKTDISLPQGVGVFYSFNKMHRGFKPIRDEVGLSFNKGMLSSYISYFEQQPLTKLFGEYDLVKIKQANLGATLQLTNNLSIQNDFRVDLKQKNRMQLLIHTIGVTYVMDCVSMHTKFVNDHTFDRTRGISKQHDISFSIGLKTINM